MILPITLSRHEKELMSYAMLDTGAEGKRFVDKEWAQDHGLKLLPLKRPIRLETFDGQEAESGPITHYVQMHMRINDHQEKRACFLVTQLAHYPVVLGLPWLKIHDPRIGFAEHTVLFDSKYCQEHCNVPTRPAKIQALHDIPRKTRPKHLPARPEGLEHQDIAAISLSACSAYARKNYCMFTVTVKDIEAALNPTPDEEDPTTKLPPEFQDFADVFSPKEAERLPPHRPYDHDIKLQEGKVPPFGPLYPMSREELKALKEWIEENLKKGFIRPSSSPAASPVLFVKKPGGGL